MTKDNTTVEVNASTVEEAIEKGLDQLGLPRDAVDVEVLDEGHQGFLGIGNRDACIKLIVKELTVKKIDENPISTINENPPVKKAELIFPEEIDKIEENKNNAVEIVHELIARMKIDAKISGRVIEPEDERDHPMILVEVTGNDLSVLIGRRSETLNALQYIASLMLCEKAGEWIPLNLDVQGYRMRRENQLRQLARRLADQVIQTGRRQVLETMPANERRIIHLELRYHPFVTTTSIGEEPNRKTTIILKPK
jgi:spoIIIJ-associated protein